MAWAKLHTDILGDPKLMRAARKGAKGLELLPWIIAFAKQADDNGRLSVGGEPAEARDIASLVPNSTPKSIANCLVSLETIGVLRRDSSNFLCFSAWEHRSGGKPSDAPSAIAERVARHRAAKSLKHNDSGNDGNALQGDTGNATEKRREEENREEKRRGERTAASRPPLPAWVGRVRERWQDHVGDASPTQLHRSLASYVATHGEPLILEAIVEYADAKRGKAQSLKFFVAEIVQWVAKARADGEPLVVDGWLSAAGDAATAPR